MNTQIKEPIPTGIKIFATLYVIKSTLPILIASIIKMFELDISPALSSILSSLSVRADKILKMYEYSSSVLIIAILFSLIILFVYYTIMTNQSKFDVYKKPGMLSFTRIVVILGLITTYTKGASSDTREAYFAIFSSLLLLIAFLIYLFTKQAKMFFSNHPPFSPLQNNQNINRE